MKAKIGLVALLVIAGGCGGPGSEGDSDLAPAAVADIAVPVDVASPAASSDLAMSASVDMSTPPDMTTCAGFGEACGCCDQAKAAAAGFFGLWCDPASHKCQGCGTKAGDHCCDRPELQGLGRCNTSGVVLSCRSNVCSACGNLNQGTCAISPACNPPWTPMQGQCM